MTTSSAQPIYSITSSSSVDTITLSDTITLNDTITISNGASSSYYYTGAGVAGSSGNTITITGATGSSSYTIGGAGTGGFIAQDISSLDPNIFTWKSPEEFVDTLPDITRIQKMCEEYPGLKIAYEKFVTTYKLVKDHYDTPEDKRPLP